MGNHWLGLPYDLLVERLENRNESPWPMTEIILWEEAVVNKIQETIDNYNRLKPGSRSECCLAARSIFYYVCADIVRNAVYNDIWNQEYADEQIDQVARHNSTCRICQKILTALWSSHVFPAAVLIHSRKKVGATTYGWIIELLDDKCVSEANYWILNYHLRKRIPDVEGLRKMSEIFFLAILGQMPGIMECRELVPGYGRSMTYGEYVRHWYGNGYATFAARFRQHTGDNADENWPEFREWLIALAQGTTKY